MTATLLTILAFIQPYIVPVVGAAASWLFVQLGGLISSKVKDQRVQTVLLRLDDAVLTAIRYVEQTMQGAPSGAKLSAATSAVKSYLGTNGVRDLAHAFRLDESAAGKLIIDRIEAAVHTHLTPAPNPVLDTLTALAPAVLAGLAKPPAPTGG